MVTDSRGYRGKAAAGSLRHRLGAETLERRAMPAAVGPIHPRVLVEPARIVTSEDGGSALVGVRLTRAPTADVTIGVSSSDTDEGTVGVSSLTFTPGNWNAFQRLRVTGVADGVRDGNRVYTIKIAPASSADPAFNGLDGRDVIAVNRDSRRLVAGVWVKPTAGLQTSEEGRTASFRVKLTYKPTAVVTIPLASSRPEEGVPDTSQLVFTPDTWNLPQTVTVKGLPDGVRDGNKPYRIVTGVTVSSDPKYAGLPVADVRLVNKDSLRLVAGVKVYPTAGRFTTASGGMTSFSMVLTYKPTADVTIPVGSSNPSVGVTTVSSLTFTPDNWLTPQDVVVVGRDAGVVNSQTRYRIITGPTASADPLYAGLDPVDVLVVNRPRTDVGRFNGRYEGTFTGRGTYGGIPRPVSGAVACRVVDGVITVTAPDTGSGSVVGTGAVGFSGTSGVVEGATFVGTFTEGSEPGDIRARGTWKYVSGPVTGSGFWNIRRVGDA